MDISIEQVVYLVLFLIGMGLLSYLIKIAKNITLLVVAVAGSGYILTTPADQISIDSAFNWAEEKSQVTGEAAQQVLKRAGDIDADQLADAAKIGQELF